MGEFDGDLGVRDQAPVIKGATNETIELNDSFDVLAGVTAIDQEDGDLTAKITTTGTVDSAKVGEYQVTYSVTDSQKNHSEKVRTITVVDPNANTKPIFSGLKDQTIEVGTNFDKLAGVTANDQEDGDLTAKIAVTGDVDTLKAGANVLTYTVSDSKGEKTTQTITITVQEKESIPAYSATTVYVKGDKLSYQGTTYTAKWWTKGDTPGSAQVWEKEIIKNEDGSVDYYKGGTYVAGDLVNYNGKQYLAKWWTQSVPGSDASWELKK